MKLLNEETIKIILEGERFADSHGASKRNNLGVGLMYYSIVHMLKANLCVCLGSGSGFVPKLMRQAQQDLNLGFSKTYLVDANICDERFGIPDYHGPATPFTLNFPDVLIIRKKTVESMDFFKKEEIDFLHIDADHTYEGVKADFENYFPLVKPGGVITLHDTKSPDCGVKEFINEIDLDLYSHGRFQLIDFPIGNGTALVRKK